VIGSVQVVVIKISSRRTFGERGESLSYPQFLTNLNNFQGACHVANSSQVAVKKNLIEGEIRGIGGSLP